MLWVSRSSAGSSRPLGASGTSLSCSSSAACAGGCRGGCVRCAAVSLEASVGVGRGSAPFLPRSRLKAAIACGRGSASSSSSEGLDKLNLFWGRRTQRMQRFVCKERSVVTFVRFGAGHVARPGSVDPLLRGDWSVSASTVAPTIIAVHRAGRQCANIHPQDKALAGLMGVGGHDNELFGRILLSRRGKAYPSIQGAPDRSPASTRCLV